MANNCDYCHKPLSLMRRLRGEQFCSLEHLDAYSAQQAEFALERLAASVSDKPNTERPPLPKPAPKLRHIATPAETAPEVPVTSGAVAVQEREPGEGFEQEGFEQEGFQQERFEEVPSDYPLAPYLDQPVPPREFEAAENRRSGFALVDDWGKATPGWTMSPFRSEPSDPRTWTAGKLVAQIPPLAGWRELPAPKARLDPAPRALLGEEIASGTAEAFLQVPPTLVSTIRNEFVLAGNLFAKAERLPAALRPQASSCDWNQLAEAYFLPAPLAQGDVPFSTTAMPSLQVALPQAVAPRVKPSQIGRTLEPEIPLHPAAQAVALPLLLRWSRAQSMSAPKVPMPEFTPARLGKAVPLGMEGWMEAWQETRATVQGPAGRLLAAYLGYNGPAFGWESSTGRQAILNPIATLELPQVPGSPSLPDFRARVNTEVVSPGPRPLPWDRLRTNTLQFESRPLCPLVTVTAVRWLPLMPFRMARAAAAARIAPPASLRPILRAAKPPLQAPAATKALVATKAPAATKEERTQITHSGPLKYSPLAIVVLPPPQFALLPAALADEQRYVAQAPNGIWRLPGVRPTGYRSLGPFPKLPLRMPDQHLRASAPEMPPAVDELRLRGVETQQDLSGMPRFATPGAVRVHPADYLAWPQPKGQKLGRMHPEHASPENPAVPSVKRFGPGRASERDPRRFLQDRGRNADGLAKA